MKLSTKSRYGTRLVLDIAMNQHAGPVRINDTAVRQCLSLKYLERIAQLLKAAGVIKSKRGKKGGHLLAMPADQITIGRIIRVLEDDPALAACVHSTVPCENASTCPARIIWSEAGEALFRHLDAMTLQSVITRTKRPPPQDSPAAPCPDFSQAATAAPDIPPEERLSAQRRKARAPMASRARELCHASRKCKE